MLYLALLAACIFGLGQIVKIAERVFGTILAHVLMAPGALMAQHIGFNLIAQWLPPRKD